MNASSHRLIFNKSRGCLMAVSETASSSSKGASGTSCSRTTLQGSSTRCKTLKTSQIKLLNKPLADVICAQAAPVFIASEHKASQSNQASQSNTAKASTLAAGGNVNVTATGAGKQSSILIQGSEVKADNAVNLAADNQINLQAAKNESSQLSTNTNSSGSISISYGAGGWGFGASASKGQGKSDGQDLSYTNTQITAGNIASIKSGGDTNIKGAVIAANTIKADVGQQLGGSLNIESLQDKSSYTSEQKSVSGSISVGGGGNGASISASKSNIDSTFKSVTQQSGLKAGDGGFQVSVANNTDLKGGVIASTQKAVDDKTNTFSTGGQLTTTDVQNSASFKGTASGLSIDVGKKDGKFGTTGVGIGAGGDKGNAASTTAAGITGVAGNKAARTSDAETGLQKIFDADKTQKKIDAEVAITTAFTKQAPKAAATFLDKQIEDIKVRLLDQTLTPAKRAELLQDIKDRSEGGIVRIVVQTAVGALGGGASGALGAGISASAAPLLNDFQDSMAKRLEASGMSPSAAKLMAQGITGLTAAGVGAVVGGGQGAAYGAAVDFNNRQLHPTERQRAADLAAISKGKGNFTKAQIEEQMRLMGNDAFGVEPNKPEVLTTQQAIEANLALDPGMPKVSDRGVVVEILGQANPEIQQFIIANTKDGAGYIPGASPYKPSNPALDAPNRTNTPPVDAVQTAKCANSDVACKSGVGVQQSVPITLPTREDIADGAATLSRQSGVVGAGAVAVGSQAGPYAQPAKAVAVGATAIGFVADVVEQIARPDTGQTSINLSGTGAMLLVEQLPGGKLVAPITNEVVEAGKNSSFAKDITDRINRLFLPKVSKEKK